MILYNWSSTACWSFFWGVMVYRNKYKTYSVTSGLALISWSQTSWSETWRESLTKGIFWATHVNQKWSVFPGHVETQTMQTVDWRLCRPCRLSVIFFTCTYIFSSKILTIVSHFPSLCALCITITDVHLQRSKKWENRGLMFTGRCKM